MATSRTYSKSGKERIRGRKARGIDAENDSSANVSFDRPLPLAALYPDSFERFCLDFIAALLQSNAVVHAAGKSGHKQGGLDIKATFLDGTTHTFQCKREASFGPAKVAKAVCAHTVISDNKFILLSCVASPAARTEAGKYRHWDIWDQEDISLKFRTLPRVEQIRLVDIFFPGQRFSLLGETSPGPWITAQDFFAPLLVEGRAFNHLWAMVGREDDLEKLVSALCNVQEKVVLLTGAAGGGKTRLLRAAIDKYFISHPHMLVRVLSPTEQITSKNLEDFGFSEKLLIVDDAHDRTDLGQLVRYVGDERTKAKLLLVLRPYAADMIMRDLAKVGLSGNLVCTVKLSKPSKRDALALAQQVLKLHSAPVHAAKDISELAYDSPLAVVIGAYIVAKDHVHPQRFGSHDEFKVAVLKRYEQVITEEIAAGADQNFVRAILRIFSLVQPALPDDPQVLELLEVVEGVNQQDASRLASRLIEGGVLFKRGIDYRLSPDLLADSIIETNCVRESGSSNGYAERVYAAANPQQREHILLNLGRLDWRRNDGNTSESRLLNDLWAKLKWENDYRNADIKAAVQAAYYQPRQALEFAARLVRDGHGQDRDVCRIIRHAAYSLPHVVDACAMLWAEGKNDLRQTNQHPEHPIRILAELAAPAPRKPMEFCEAVVGFAISLFPYDENWRGTFTPFDIVRGALATEGHFTSMANSREFRMSAYGVERALVAPMRARIVEAILNSLSSVNPRRAFSSAEIIAEAIRGPTGMLNRQPSLDERNGWNLEFVDTLNRISELTARGNMPATVLVAVARSVAWHAFHANGLTQPAAQKILDLLNRDLETRATRILIDGWAIETWRSNLSGRREVIEVVSEELTTELEAAHPNSYSLAEFLEGRLLESRDFAGEGYGTPHIFLGRLISSRLDLAKEVLKARAQPNSRLGAYAAVALAVFLEKSFDEAHSQIDTLLANDEEFLSVVANAYAIFCGKRTPSNFDLALLRRIFTSSNQAVLIYTPGIVRSLLDCDPMLAVELLVEVIASVPSATRRDLLMFLLSNQLVKIEHLNMEQMVKIVESLRNLERLDDHWVWEFIQRIATYNPEIVIDLAKSRLEDSIAAGDWSKYPVGVTHHRKPLRLIEHERGPLLFQRLLDWAIPRTHDYYFASLFADLINGLFDVGSDRCLEELEAWMEGGKKEHFKMLSVILRESEASLVTKHPQFVHRMLLSARADSFQSHSDLSSVLFASAIHGVRTGTPGEPFPADIELKEHAESRLAHLGRADPAFELYDSLRRHAIDCIERQLAAGRRMDEADSDG